MENKDYTMAEAIREAKRCLNCKVPQCRKGCPISNDIPAWIHELSMGNMGNAMSIINLRSNLPAVCGRVCAHERQCEGHCVLGKQGSHINIGKLERFVSDFDSDMSLTRESIVQKDRGRVAVIGSGPAGLTIAGELARKGVAVYKRQGTGKPKRLELPGGGLWGVRYALYFLRRVSLWREGYIGRDEVPVREGDKVYVVGCGNTAMDAARTAVRLGASEVTVLYHRDINSMAALRAEYDDAVTEGVRFRWNTSIKSIHDTEGILDELILNTPDGEVSVAADKVIMAVGSAPASRIVSTTEGIEVNEKGYVITRDMPYGMTTRKGVFAGGDVTDRPATVVHAMQDARRVAEGMLRYLDAVKLFDAIDKENIPSE